MEKDLTISSKDIRIRCLGQNVFCEGMATYIAGNLGSLKSRANLLMDFHKIGVIPPSHVVCTRIRIILPLQLSSKTTCFVHLLNGIFLKSCVHIG